MKRCLFKKYYLLHSFSDCWGKITFPDYNFPDSLLMVRFFKQSSSDKSFMYGLIDPISNKCLVASRDFSLLYGLAESFYSESCDY